MDGRARFAVAVTASALLGWVLLDDWPDAPPASQVAWPAAAPTSAPEREPEVVLAEPVQERGASGARAPSRAPGSSETDRPTFEVTVVDVAGEPLAGASVRCTAEGATLESTTDGEGRARFSISAAALRARVSAEKPGFFHVEREVSTAVGHELTLHGAVALSGRVEDPGSAGPVAGAALSFAHADCTDCAPERVFSDAAGAYRFAAFPGGRRVELQVEAAGYVSLRASLEVGPQALGAERNWLLSRGLPLAVTVIDAVTRVPIEGAEVSGVRGPWVTDGAGRLASDQLVASSGANDARAVLDFAKPGYCQLTLSPRVAELAAAGDLLVPMVRSATVVGSVVDARGNAAGPVDLDWDARFRWDSKAGHPEVLQRLGAYLTAGSTKPPPWTLSRDRLGTEPHFRAGAEGRFVLQGAVPWMPGLELVACAENGTRGTASLSAPGPGETRETVIWLRDGAPSAATALISGQVTVNGAPEQGRVQWQGATRRGSAPTDERGFYELIDVEPGTIELRVQGQRLLARPACTLAEAGPFSVHALAGEALEHDIQISIAMAAISGRVVDSRGAPVAGLRVEAQDSVGCWRQRAVTDEEGRYATPVPAGLPALEVVVERAPQRLSRLVAPGAEDVDFVLAELGRLRFRVLEASDGSPILAGALMWRGPGTAYQELAKLDQGIPEPGGWRTVDCVAGQIELAVVTARERHAPLVGQTVVVHPGSTSVTELVMRPSLSLRVVLGKASIAPPEGLACVVVPESVWPLIDYVAEPKPRWVGLGKIGPHDDLEFNAGGKALARGLGPGDYRIKVWPASVRIEPERLHLSGDELETTVRAQLAWR